MKSTYNIQIEGFAGDNENRKIQGCPWLSVGLILLKELGYSQQKVLNDEVAAGGLLLICCGFAAGKEYLKNNVIHCMFLSVVTSIQALLFLP